MSFWKIIIEVALKVSQKDRQIVYSANDFMVTHMYIYIIYIIYIYAYVSCKCVMYMFFIYININIYKYIYIYIKREIKGNV